MKDVDKIILTGYRATGKSAVGLKLAQALNMRFVDMDKLIEEREGCSISDLVAKHGWPYFRDIEKEMLGELAAESGVVIATGGGAIMHEEIWRKLMATGLVVWLQADRDTIVARLAIDPATSGQRPSLTGRTITEEIETVLAEREPFYHHGSHISVDTTDSTPDDIVKYISEFIKQQGN